MDKLQQAREEINAIDKQIAQLYARRMEAVKQVLKYKQQHGLPVLDTAREQAVIEKNSAFVSDEWRPYYISFLQDMMKNSRQYQSDHMADESERG